MGEKITDAVARVEEAASPGQLVERYRKVFEELLPSHLPTGTFIRLSQGLLRKDPALLQAAVNSPESFLSALADCARLGHEPGTDAYALVAFGGPRGPEVTGIEQYQGEIERMYRAGAVASVRCEVVREHDEFRWQPTQMDLPYHEFDATDEESRGALKAVYAYAIMTGGAISQVVVMPKTEVMRHKAVAKTKKIWEGDFEVSMWRKTAVHELEKWVPTSAEWLRVRLQAAAEAQQGREVMSHAALESSSAGRVTPPAEEPVDAEIVGEPAVKDGQHQVRHASPAILRRINAEYARLGWGDDARDSKTQATEALAGRELGEGRSRNLYAAEAEVILGVLRACPDLPALLKAMDAATGYTSPPETTPEEGKTDR